MFSAAFAVILGLAIICRINARKMGGGGGGGGGRGGGGGGARDKAAPVLLWSAVVLFAAAGTLAPGTFINDIVGAVLSIHPSLPWLFGFGMIVAIARDLWYDKSPDKAAPFALFLLPVISNHLGGWVGRTIQDFWAMYGEMVRGWISSAFGV